jgi:hypothetical protein
MSNPADGTVRCRLRFLRVAVLAERPRRLEVDDEGQLHATDGNAVEWPDGFGFRARDCVRMSELEHD